MSKRNKQLPPSPATASDTSPAEKDTALREQLYKDSYDELVKKQISNSENFDKSVLTLSASGLGVSLAFVKDIAPVAQAHARGLLVSSWSLFALAIIFTVASFMASQRAIKFQITAARRYYLERQDAYATKMGFAAHLTNWLNFCSGGAFIAAVVCTVVFVVKNLPPAKP